MIKDNKKLKKIPVSVVVCTLNEEDNIKGCILAIKKNDPVEIIVVDGGSKDKTIRIVKKMGVEVTSSKKGLALQRQIGVDNAFGQYIAFVDADDRLEENSLKTLVQELEENKYDAIQAQTLSYKPVTYWEKAMDCNLRYFISKPGKSNMLGRPALYKKSVFKKVSFDPIFNFGSEDTDLSRQLELKGFIQGIGTGKSLRKHLKTFGECNKQWLRYGKGDALFAYKYKNRLNKILYHLLVNYPIKKSWVMFLNKKSKYIPFFILQGWVRLIGFSKELIKLNIGNTPFADKDFK